MIEKVSCFTVVQHNTDFLLVTEQKQGLEVTGLVGGTMDPEDLGSPEACALREGAEESGIEIALTGLLLYTRSLIPGTKNEEHERIIFSGVPVEAGGVRDALLPNARFYTYQDIKQMHKTETQHVGEQLILRANGTWQAIRAAEKHEPLPVTSWIDLRARASSRSKQERRRSSFLIAA